MLPQELFNEIIDLVSDDRPSLIALSRTAQCLRTRSQAFLFHDLVLSPHHSPTSYIPLLEMSPHILAYVRRLRIIASKFLIARVHEARSLKRLIRAVMHVDHIELTGMAKAEVLTKPGGLLPIISSPKVRTVTLTTGLLPKPQFLFKLLSYFPSVSSLHLEDSGYAMGTSPWLDSGSIFLTELSLSAGMASSPLGVCLFNNAAGGWLRRLRSLIIDGYSAEELFIISEFIPTLLHLVTLTLKRPLGDISHTDTQQRLAEDIPVFPFQRIRSLHLVLYGFTLSWTRWWLSHLTQAAAGSLEYLAIDFLYAAVDGPSEVDWNAEVALLCLPKLKSVSIRTVADERI